MALNDRKIPIIPTTPDRVGNDIPSTVGQPNHPNASLLCKRYNDLIDNELTALQDTKLTRQQVYQAMLLIPQYKVIYFLKDVVTGDFSHLQSTNYNVFYDNVYSSLWEQEYDYYPVTVQSVSYVSSADAGNSEFILGQANATSFGDIFIGANGDFVVNAFNPDAQFLRLRIDYTVTGITPPEGSYYLLLDLVVLPDLRTIEPSTTWTGGGGGGS